MEEGEGNFTLEAVQTKKIQSHKWISRRTLPVESGNFLAHLQ